jgi:membrane associated rhomboid family serine protease
MFDRITPVVKNLLLVNVAIFFLSSVLRGVQVDNIFAFYNPFLPNAETFLSPLFKPWQIISYMFLHGSLGHLFSNMFGLFIFGPILETYMGSKRFFWYYILTGVGAALIYSGINYYELSQMVVDSDAYLSEVTTPMVGASGAIFGILAAFGFIFPNLEMMLLFFPFPIKAKYFVTMYGLYELFQGAAGYQTGVAHFAHVGGLVAGVILLKFFKFEQRIH